MKKFFLSLITVFVIFCVYWAGGRTLMLKTLDGEIKTLETQGYDIDHKGLSAGGFPLLFRSTFMEPDIVSPRSLSKPWSIKADKLVLKASTFTPLSWTATHRGEARIDMRGPKGERWLFDVRPMSLDLDIKAKIDGTVKALNADLSRAQIQAVIGTLPPIVGVDTAQLEIRPQKGDMRYELSLNNVFLEKDTLAKWQTAFGPKISVIDAVILAKDQTSLSKEGLLKWKNNQKIIGQTWRVNWNENIFTGDFDLTLTDTGFDGSLRAEVENLPEIIDQFARAGMFTPKQVSSLKIGTRLLPQNANGRQEITFNFRDGYLLLFGQRLYKF